MASASDKKCNICENYFPEQIFNAHQSLHSEDKFHPCKITCGKFFTSKDELLKHNCDGSQVFPLKLFPCDICGKSFKQKNNLTRHRRTHTGEKPYECEICKNTFSVSSALARHKRIHTGDRPYPCDMCEKAFIQSGLLANHKMVHTGENPYECKICKKILSKKETLANHKRVHTGEKPYSCNICQKSFSDRSNLSQHFKSSAHLKRMINIDSSLHLNNVIDCGEIIKIEDIKGKIQKEESVEDPLSIHQEDKNSNICEDNKEKIKEEVKEEESVDDPLYIQEGKIRRKYDDLCIEAKEEGIDDDTLFVQEIYNSGDEENNTVVDDIDIVCHKIEME